jgi:general secretion pathway protein M
MRPLSARERRLVAIGLLLAALALIYLVVISPLVGGFVGRAEERQTLIATYQRDQRIMASIPVWRRAAEAQRVTSQRFILTAASEQIAVEALKERLSRLAADEGFQITAMQDLEADSPTGQARVRADLQLTLTQLNESLRRLETEGPYVVEYLSVSADNALATGRSARMAVRLEVSAAWRPIRSRSS